MRRYRGAVLGLFVLVLGVVFAAPANAAVPPPSLVGEQFAAGLDTPAGDFSTMGFSCNADQTGTIPFTATGPAVGPYPGFFMESGTVTIGAAGTITSLTAHFEITALDGTTISGTKTVLPAPTNAGYCASFLDAGFDLFFDSLVSYTATITLPDNSMWQDAGTGHVVGHDALPGGLLAVPEPTSTANIFEESFDTSNGVVPLPSTGHVTGGGWILGPPTALGRVSFGFVAKSDSSGMHVACTVLDHALSAQFKCKTIDSLIVVGTHATFSGQGTFNRSSTLIHYTIDVDDLGEPGTLDTFKVVLGNGYTAGGPLLGGNIQIH